MVSLAFQIAIMGPAVLTEILRAIHLEEEVTGHVQLLPSSKLPQQDFSTLCDDVQAGGQLKTSAKLLLTQHQHPHQDIVQNHLQFLIGKDQYVHLSLLSIIDTLQGRQLCQVVLTPIFKGVYYKREEFAPLGSKFFPFRVDPCQKGAKF